MVADGRRTASWAEAGLSAALTDRQVAPGPIARKLGSGDRAQMVATAIRNGYIR